MDSITETFFNTGRIKRFYFPGRIFWGEGCVSMLSDILESQASVEIFVDRAFLHHPLLKVLRKRLDSRLASEFPVMSMPVAEQIVTYVKKRQNTPQAILALGGGSTIDSAKAAMAVSLYGTLDGVGMGEKRGMEPIPGSAKPLFIAVPTTAGTGAEASRYYVTYSADGRAKQHGKSWKLIADWIFLDPAFVKDAPEQVIIESAFDAFIHFLESYLCRHESSWTNNMLSLDGIPRLMASLHSVVVEKNAEPQTLLALQHAACMGGVAISNVRTGHIHEAAGALLELTGLTHPQTLYAFFRDGIGVMAGHADEKLASLSRAVSAAAPNLGIHFFADIVNWWERMLQHAGSEAALRKAVQGMYEPQLAIVRESIIRRVIEDKVWSEKECPTVLDLKKVTWLAETVLARFGAPP